MKLGLDESEFMDRFIVRERGGGGYRWMTFAEAREVDPTISRSRLDRARRRDRLAGRFADEPVSFRLASGFTGPDAVTVSFDGPAMGMELVEFVAFAASFGLAFGRSLSGKPIAFEGGAADVQRFMDAIDGFDS